MESKFLDTYCFFSFYITGQLTGSLEGEYKCKKEVGLISFYMVIKIFFFLKEYGNKVGLRSSNLIIIR